MSLDINSSSARTKRSKFARKSSVLENSDDFLTRLEHLFEKPLATHLKLSAYQRKLLVESWPKIYLTGAYKIGVPLFRHLCDRNPTVKALMQPCDNTKDRCQDRGSSSLARSPSKKAPGVCPQSHLSNESLNEHGMRLVELFELALQSLDAPAQTVRKCCMKIGLQHGALHGEGFTSNLWDDLSDVMWEYIQKREVVTKHRELGKAWASLIAFIFDKMKEGYQLNAAATRRKSFEASSSSVLDPKASLPMMAMNSLQE